MELNESGGLSSYYHHQHQHHHHNQPPTAATSPANGIAPNSAATTSHMVYPGSVPSAVSSPLKRKRGRPRKYGTAEQAAAAKRLSSISPSKKKEQGPLDGGGSSHSFVKKSHFSAFGAGDAGRRFTAHIINVVAAEDVGQKITAFAQQSKHEMCILSASGTISNAFLLQPGGNITYEGRFDILSLSGSYAHDGQGRKTGGLSICLASSDGQIIGGGVGGPLVAAGPIQVIVGTFVADKKKNITEGLIRRDVSAQIDGESTSGMGIRSMVDSSHQSIGGSQFMMHQQSMQSTEWRGNTPENGDYDHFGD